MSQTLPPTPPAPAAAPPGPGPHLTLLAAAVVVHDAARHRALFLRRGPRARFGQGLWDLPVGKCDAGEPITVAAVRELREETGLVARPEDLRLAQVVHAAHGVESPGGFLTVAFVLDRWRGEPVNAEPEKHAEVRWFDLDALPGPDEVVLTADRIVTRALGEAPGVTLHGWAE